jgi:hypothetical protein
LSHIILPQIEIYQNANGVTLYTALECSLNAKSRKKYEKVAGDWGLGTGEQGAGNREQGTGAW